MSIEARALTKRYGEKTAVDDLSFEVRPGRVTGFLGPNGAGKTTTMRLILGLDYPSRGSVAVNGKPFSRLYSPMREVGALLDPNARHGGRSAYDHLLCLAQSNDIPRRRVSEVLSVVGLSEVARKRSGGFSLGMSQRLGIAAALLGDPDILMFDEPVNGLDPEGILWIRNLMKGLAAEGRTVFDLDEYAFAGLRAGASGFLVKDALPTELLSGIRAVASGDAVVAPALTRRLIEKYAHLLPSAADPDAAGPDPRLAVLTSREREVLQAIARGWTNSEIANRLHLAESTVKTHVSRVLAKIGARDRVQAVIFAYDTGLVRPA